MYTKISEKYNRKERRNRGKKGTERRVYSKQFKAEAVALAQKLEKPIREIVMDLRDQRECAAPLNTANPPSL